MASSTHRNGVACLLPLVVSRTLSGKRIRKAAGGHCCLTRLGIGLPQVHAGLSANNLLPQWQFGNVSGWRRFPASIKSVEWTDGTSVSAATCLEENHIGELT